MAAVKYYYDLMSQPSRALYIFLKHTTIPFEGREVALRKREHQTDEFKRDLNRFQKVPFIHHGDFKLAESDAIVKYLVREYRSLVPDHWYPKDSKAQARVDEYLAWHHVGTRMPCATYFVYKWMIPIITQSPPDEDIIAKHEGNVVTCLDQLEELFLSQGHQYLASDSISIADLFASCELEQLKVADYDVTQGRPVLTAWLNRVREKCNPFYDEAHTIIKKAAQRNQPKL